MFRGILTLTLSLCLGAVAAPAALAQAAPAITEQEAHAIAVDAYVYFCSILSMGMSRNLPPVVKTQTTVGLSAQ